jgi:hypothetical protein
MDTQQEKQQEDGVVETAQTVPAPTADPMPVAEAAPRTPWYKNPVLISSILAVALVGGAGWWYYGQHIREGGIIATVNGAPIYQNDFDEAARIVRENAAANGVDVESAEAVQAIKDQVLQNLIENALLTGAAKDAGITVSEEAASEVYANIVAEVGGAEALAARIAEMGITEAKLQANVRERILVDDYLESVSEIESVTVSDTEVEAFLKENVPEGTELPKMEDLRPIIESEIIKRKQRQIITDILTSLRENAEIDIRI